MRILFTIFLAAVAAFSANLYAQDWEPLEGPDGAAFFGMLQTPAGSVVAWQRLGGFVRSADGGRSWMRSTRDRSDFSGSYIGPRMFEQQGVLYAEQEARTHILRSCDDGVTWDSIPAPDDYFLLAVTPEHEIIVLDGEQLQASADTGRNWRSINLHLSAYFGSDVRVAATAGGSWFAQLPTDGVYRSTDRGGSWQRVLEGVENSSHEALVLLDDDRLFSCMETQLRLSSDGGETWEVCNGIDDRIRRVVRRDHYYLLAHSQSALYRSTDQGVSWAMLSTPEFGLIHELLGLQDGTLLAQTNMRLLRSTDAGASWRESMGGFPHAGPRAALDGRPDDLLVARLESGTRRSGDYGDSWMRSVSPDGVSLDAPFLYARDGSLYAFRWSRNLGVSVFRSTDGGTQWQIRTIIPLVTSPLLLTETLTESDAGLLAADYTGLLMQSSDEGRSWSTSFGNLQSLMQQAQGGLQKLIALPPPQGNVVLAAASPGGLLRSTNGGQQWTRVPLDPTTPSLSCDNILVTGDGTAFALSDSTLYRSTDLGATWESILIVDPGMAPDHLLLDARDELYVYLPNRSTGSEIHVLHSADDGATWELLSLPSLPAPPDEITGVHFDDQNRLYVSTWFDGAFRLRFPLSAAVAPLLPDGPRITGVYPQPLRVGGDATLRVQITIPTATAPELQLCDVSGRVLRRHAAGSLSPGVHALRLNTHGLAAGSYLLRIVQQGAAVSMRMILIN